MWETNHPLSVLLASASDRDLLFVVGSIMISRFCNTLWTSICFYRMLHSLIAFVIESKEVTEVTESKEVLVVVPHQEGLKLQLHSVLLSLLIAACVIAAFSSWYDLKETSMCISSGYFQHFAFSIIQKC